ncbi:unnamed protein product [Commensalibacter communis]|uniref:hypothetical protein n=1 Tax=Commensalibacter communis TaxID=2972786 RepID=UPI0022FFC305|nr:hypothetical protein [Commensalibacter communis]CAI3953793.1 unnamed protein product [Commensalibacter communis]CAI3959041.1 unnamed protein product [Commensalibacter communis]
MKKLSEVNTKKWRVFTRKCRKMDGDVKNYKDSVCDAIIEEYGGLRHGAKILACKLNLSYRSVERWFYKETAPKGDQLLDLMAENDEIASRILSLVEERKQKRQRENAVD